MIGRSAEWVAAACGGKLVAGDPSGEGPRRAVVDSRLVEPGDLFVGLRGQHVDGAAFADGALRAGAWGVVVAETGDRRPETGCVITAADPLEALQRLATAWRRELGARVVGITGSTGKTSTKDILTALLQASGVSVHANRENLNTEIGLPLTILEADRAEVLVLEMAMRGVGQIAELAAIAEPDVGVIVNVGPVHLELLGSVEAVATAKAELIRDLKPEGAAVVPAGEQLLEPHLRKDLQTTTFGPGGDVSLLAYENGRARFATPNGELELELSYSEPHNLLNTCAAIAAALALGEPPVGRVEPRFSSLRGEVVELDGGVTVVNDCYNANPMSMRAAIEHLAATPAERRVAVLGTMAELGPDSERFHREIGELAAERAIDVLITVGEGATPIGDAFDGERYAVATPEEAGALLDELSQPGDRVLIKGSRSAGLERVLEPA